MPLLVLPLASLLFLDGSNTCCALRLSLVPKNTQILKVSLVLLVYVNSHIYFLAYVSLPSV